MRYWGVATTVGYEVAVSAIVVGVARRLLGVLSRQLRPSTAWLLAIVLATVPILAFDDYGFLSSRASDAPGGLFSRCECVVFVGLVAFLFVCVSRTIYWRCLVLGSIAAAMTVFTKDEGIAFLLVDAGLLLLLGVIAQRGSSEYMWIVALRFRLAAAGLFFAVAICLLARLVVASWAAAGDNRNGLQRTVELADVAGGIGHAAVVAAAYGRPHVFSGSRDGAGVVGDGDGGFGASSPCGASGTVNRVGGCDRRHCGVVGGGHDRSDAS